MTKTKKDQETDVLFEKFKGQVFSTREGYEDYKKSILHMYQQRLNNEIASFPRYFFYGVDGEINGHIILKYIMYEIIKLDSFDDIYKYYTKEFFRKYKIDSLRVYYGSIEEVFNKIFFDQKFKIDEYLKYNKKGAALKTMQNRTDDEKRDYYKNKLLIILNEDRIEVRDIPNIFTPTYVKNKGLNNALKYFNNSLFNYINYIYPGEFKKKEFQR